MNENATNEAAFHTRADAALGALYHTLEEADAAGALEVEYENGILHVALPSRKQYVISKHAPSRQIWLSSPVSGGLHFSFEGGEWVLPDGRELCALLVAELRALANIDIK